MKKIIRGLVMVLVLASPIVFATPHIADAQDKKPKAAAAGAVFEMYKDKAGEFRFRLKDTDGNLLAISGKGYEKKGECQTVIDAIKKDAAKAKVEEEK
jgi:uncharacterized protein YegP (UPF0339 family)